MSNEPAVPVRTRNDAEAASARAEGFTPSDAMRRYLEACLDPAREDQAARIKAARVRRHVLKRWTENPDFRAWLRSEIERRLADHAWEVWLTVQRLARQGNLTAAKLHLNRFDTEADIPDATPHDFLSLVRMAGDIEEE